MNLETWTHQPTQREFELFLSPRKCGTLRLALTTIRLSLSWKYARISCVKYIKCTGVEEESVQYAHAKFLRVASCESRKRPAAQRGDPFAHVDLFRLGCDDEWVL